MLEFYRLLPSPLGISTEIDRVLVIIINHIHHILSYFFNTGSRIRICNIFFLREAPLPVGIYRHSHYRIRTDTVTALNDMPLPVGLCELDHIFVSLYSCNRIFFPPRVYNVSAPFRVMAFFERVPTHDVDPNSVHAIPLPRFERRYLDYETRVLPLDESGVLQTGFEPVTT